MNQGNNNQFNLDWNMGFNNPNMGNNPFGMNPNMGNNPFGMNSMMALQQHFFETMMKQFDKKVNEFKDELQVNKPKLPTITYNNHNIIDNNDVHSSVNEEEQHIKNPVKIIKKNKKNQQKNIIKPNKIILPQNPNNNNLKNISKKKAIKDLENYIEDDEDVVVIPKKNYKTIDMLTNDFEKIVNQDKMVDKKDNYWFQHENDDSNVIMYIEPLKDNESHFDNINYPKELYISHMVNGNIINRYAIDISKYTLEVQKTVIEHNQELTQQGIQGDGKALIYARTSTKNDISIDTQKVECLKYAKDNNIKLCNFGFQYDQLSARNMNNLDNELGFWTEKLENNTDLIIYSVDRLSRHLGKGIMFLEDIKRRNITVHFVLEQIKYNKNTNHAQLDMVYECLRKAENVSNLTSEKVTKSIQKRKAEGHVFGQAPYGFKHIKINGILKRVEDEQEQETITIIMDQYNQNITNNNFTFTCKKITDYLKQHNILYIGNTYFQYKHVKRIVKKQLNNMNLDYEINE